MIDEIKKIFKETVPPGIEYASIRYVNERSEVMMVEKEVPRPVGKETDRGVMVVVAGKSSYGYAATSALTHEGIKHAFNEALRWCELTKNNSVSGVAQFPRHNHKAQYKTRVQKPWETISTSAKFELLVSECKKLKIDPRIVHYMTSLWSTHSENLFLTTDGAEISQNFSFLVPQLSATANEGTNTQTRTQSGHNMVRQGGMEVLEYFNFFAHGPTIAREALELLTAPPCPTDVRDLLLSPDQMYIQIHESIGHPLEMDRILGDERNYAGTSFVQIQDFGKLKYGSPLMNVTYDPTLENELNSFLYDDDGLKAEKVYLIQNGMLKASLGGYTSQQRSGVPGVANSRACSWNRPTIDRITNVNLEAGTSSFEEMVSQTEKGVYMRTNNSWSIDDSRNKFQFGCEWAQLIENGKLTQVVKNPGYRGVTVPFWNSMKAVGNQDTFEVLGTPFCGKGQPNQVVRVGHASPAALFSNIEVFGN
jgi:predicted Zn-dependent protease